MREGAHFAPLINQVEDILRNGAGITHPEDGKDGHRRHHQHHNHEDDGKIKLNLADFKFMLLQAAERSAAPPADAAC